MGVWLRTSEASAPSTQETKMPTTTQCWMSPSHSTWDCSLEKKKGTEHSCQSHPHHILSVTLRGTDPPLYVEKEAQVALHRDTTFLPLSEPASFPGLLPAGHLVACHLPDTLCCFSLMILAFVCLPVDFLSTIIQEVWTTPAFLSFCHTAWSCP